MNAAARDGQKTSSPRPVFIIGAPRSGTSVLTWCLGQHPNIFPLEETSWIARLSQGLFESYALGTSNGPATHLGSMGWNRSQFLERFGEKVNNLILEAKLDRIRFARKEALIAACIADDTADLAASELLRLACADQTSPFMLIRDPNEPKQRWVDGTPENTFFVYGLMSLFPLARFIHILREPSSVARSLINFSSVGGIATDFPEGLAFAEWQKYVKQARLVEQALGAEQVFRVRHEDLAADGRAVLRPLLDWLGEKYSPACEIPLSVKINSSKAQATLKGGTLEETEADSLWKAVVGETLSEASTEFMAELERDFLSKLQD